MAAKNQSFQPKSETEKRAMQAVAYYQQQVAPAYVSGNKGGSHSAMSASYSGGHPSNHGQDRRDYLEGYTHGSTEEALNSGIEPASSNNFYRAQMKAGMINMRSSMSERSGTNRLRSRTFHGPTSRTRTQNYSIDKPKPKPKVPPKPVDKGVSSQRTSRGLYRSNSNLEMDTAEPVEEDLSPLHREYGSTSSLDLLGTSGDNFFAMLKGYQNENIDQRSPAPPKLQELLRGKVDAKPHVLNGAAMVDKDVDDVTDSPKTKSKSKFKDRKARAKSITDGNPGILKKVFGSKPDADVTGKADAGFPDDGRSEERYRRKAFVHFDCQSVGVSLTDIKNKNHSGIMKNTATGASAASFNRNSFAGDKDDPDIIAGTDEGDGKTNILVLSCPFFRNEIGGEEERIVSLTKSTGQKISPNGAGSDGRNHTTNRHPACCGVAILDSSPSPSGQVLPPLISHKGHVIEYVDSGAYYYRHFFYGHDHQNFCSVDENLGPVAISIRREKVDPEDRVNHLGKPDYGLYQYRVICRTSELTTLRGSVIEDAIPSSTRLSSSRGVPIKEVLEFALPDVQISCLKQATAGSKTAEQLLSVDEQGISNTYKVGIMYCKAGQSSEEEMYNNEHSSPAFEEFLKLIAKKVKLKGFDKYRGGLDCKTDSTGIHSYYTTFDTNEIMFHVSTMLPYTQNNRQQLLRKRHIGNDIVTVIFQEPGSLSFTPKTVRSQFQHVFIIVQVSSPNTESVQYRVAVTRSKDVPPFGPPIPDNASFQKSAEFVDFLLAKVINAENAAHKSDKFRAMASRTRQEYLKDLAANYTTTNSLESGSKLSKFALGSGRKKERSKQKVVPDLFAKGAIVWNVQIEDYSNASQVDCLLAIAADTVVLMEESSKYIIFTIPCGTVIGWTIQTTSSLRLYFNQGEFILLRPISGEKEELDEIILRLTAVTQGTETNEISLRRNGLGQLGFHIQSEGIVTEVEEHGFAWVAGLRKGSRLVEICKVTTATQTHEQIVDILRYSTPVRVIVVPPLSDGAPRGFLTLNSHFHYSSMGVLNAVILSERAQTQREATGGRQRNSMTLPLQKKSRGGGDMKTPSPRGLSLNQELNNRYPAHSYQDSTLSSGRSSDDGRASHYSQAQSEVYESYRTRGNNPDGHISSGDEPHSRSGSHDSSDYSGSGGKQWNSRASAQSQASGQVNRGEGTTGMEVSQNSYPPSSENVYPQQTNYNTSQRRPFAAQMDYAYTGLPLTGNIALELLKQTQNTKYLLRHGNELAAANQPPDQPPSSSATNLSQISEGSSYSSGSSQVHVGAKSHIDRLNNLNKEEPTPPKRKDSLQAHKQMLSHHKKNLDGSPLSSNNSSPRSSSNSLLPRNLSGMSSEESLATRLRPGVMSYSKSVRTPPSNFQEELMRLIDPDISEKDLAAYTAKGPSQRRTRRIQRTMSDESLHSSKGTIGASEVNHIGSDVIFSRAVPQVTAAQQEELTKEQRLSPRALVNSKSATTTRSQSRTGGEARGHQVPLPESMARLDWSNLVDVATKAMESDDPEAPSVKPANEPRSRASREITEDVPPPRPPTPQDSALGATSTGLASWRSAGLSPQQVVEELEMKTAQLQQDLDKERREKSALESEVQQLRSDNVRLQEESQTAAAQLRRFTEWFFNTIDRQ